MKVVVKCFDILRHGPGDERPLVDYQLHTRLDGEIEYTGDREESQILLLRFSTLDEAADRFEKIATALREVRPCER